jgi:hypothetical protein
LVGPETVRTTRDREASVVVGAGILWIIIVVVLVILVLGFFFGRGRW